MFLRRPEPDTPTVEPLRINKRESISPQSTGSRPGAAPTSNPAGPAGSMAPLPYPSDDPGRRASPQPGPHPQWSIHTHAPPDGVSQVPTIPPPALQPQRSGRSDTSFTGAGPGDAAAAQAQGARRRDERVSPTLGERRGNMPLPFPESPPRKSLEDDGLFAKRPQRPAHEQKASTGGDTAAQASLNPYPEYHQQYWPPPATTGSGPATGGGLAQPQPAPVSRLGSTASASTTRAERGSPPPPPNGRTQTSGSGADALHAPQPTVNRLNSTASTYTTRAERGSPPPPETPISPAGAGPPGDIASRYAAAGIAGTATLSHLQSQNAAAAQRANQYAPATSQGQARRPWTPTEQPGSQPYGPPTVYQGPTEVAGSPPRSHASSEGTAPSGRPPRPAGQTGLEDEMQRMQMSSSPPPAYSSVPHHVPAGQGYPNEKQNSGAAVAAGPMPASNGVPPNQIPTTHVTGPTQDPRSGPSPQPGHDPHGPIPQIVGPQADLAGPTPASPPPLPEGWIAHLDPNSGQYYYIHLRTQSTQWEFPKGPTPLNLNEPMSPTHSTYAGHALASPGLSAFGGKPLNSPGFPSPGFPPMKPGYAESIMSVGGASSVSTGMSGPPPSGIEMYKVAPTNGVYFGPYLRYINMDLERGLWLGSILLVTETGQPPTIHIHQSVDLSPNRKSLPSPCI